MSDNWDQEEEKAAEIISASMRERVAVLLQRHAEKLPGTAVLACEHMNLSRQQFCKVLNGDTKGMRFERLIDAASFCGNEIRLLINGK